MKTFLLAMLLWLPMSATVFYVDGGAGSDSNNGTATNTAWLHIPGTTNLTGSGWVQLTDADTLWMKGGTSNIMVMLNTTWYVGASSFDSIQLRSGHLRTPQWGTARAIIDSRNTYHSGFWIGNNTALRGVTVEGFEVRNIAGGGVGVGFDSTSGSACIDVGGSTAPGFITIRNCYLHDAIRTVDDTGHGIEVSSAVGTQFIFEQNLVGPNIGTKGIEVYRSNQGRISQNYVLAGTTHGVTGDHGIVISGNNWDMTGNLVSVHDGVHDPIYGVKVTGDRNDLWNNVVFCAQNRPVDISGVYLVQANDASGFGSANRFLCNTVMRLGSTINYAEEGQGLVLGVQGGVGTTDNIVMNNLLTFSTNQAGGFNMSYDPSTRKMNMRFNDFFSGTSGNVISMGRTAPSSYTVASFQALGFDAGTTVANNSQADPVYVGGSLPTGMDANWHPNSGYFALGTGSPAGVQATGNSLAGLGDTVHGYSSAANKFSVDILGLPRVNWSMGAYEAGGGLPQLPPPILSAGGQLILSWDSVPGADSYRLFQAIGTNAFAWASTYTSTNATVLVSTNQVTRFYTTAFDSTGKFVESNPSNVWTNTPAAPPPQQLSAPTNLRGTRVQGTRLDLDWESDLSASTEVERSVFSAPFERIETVAAGTWHTSTTIKNKTDYQFRVRSVDASNASPYSNTILIYWRK